MIIKAEQKYARQTPTRLRLVAHAVRDLSPKDAVEQLGFVNKKAARTLREVLKQAVANATNNLGISADTLKIKEITIGEGPQYKRFRAVSRGRAHTILKRTAHIKVLLESAETAKPKKTAVKVEPKKEDKKESVVQAAKPNVQTLPAMKKMGTKAQQSVKPVSVRKTGER